MVVESDKADMDVEAFEDIFLSATLKHEGTTIDVGAPVGILYPNVADISKISATLSQPIALTMPELSSIQANNTHG